MQRTFLVTALLLCPAPLLGQQPNRTATELYLDARGSVVRVISGISNGSGFVIDDRQLGRVIITNAHVVGPGQDLSVVVADSLRLPALVIADNRRTDLAVLRADLAGCASCKPISLARSGVRPLPGTPVFAIGYPLGLGSSFSGGIITGQSERLLFSDVDINSGNSGGPLIDEAGEVVGVNTFIRPSQAGPGISGIVDVRLVRDILALARERTEERSLPAHFSDTLPMLNRRPYSIDELLAAADSVDFGDYNDFGKLESRDFELAVYTPVSLLAIRREQERQLSERRRKREVARGVLPLNWYNERSEFREWFEDLGDITQPYVVLRIVPKTGKTTGSVIGNILAGVGGAVAAAATNTPYLVTDYSNEYEFKGDLAGARFLRYRGIDTQSREWQLAGDTIRPLIGGIHPFRVFFAGELVEFRDVAFGGTYVLDPEAFRPDSRGHPARIMVGFSDLTNDEDKDAQWYELPPKVSGRIWNDFRPYYTEVLGQETPSARTNDLEWVCSRQGGRCLRL